ncbi:hypothetical protein M758_9G051100 [Ceratodon purpureus]|uniref:Secreted protein n=1 Tax=Ceratodon purpureus TaxID=3225 RepID=A0A8T0GT00_CERPU|nr:hypothetical protein KC19_9G051700 [Ceratodon purpureus]KAG0605349.1 hypothetical protein M758_9G051100 [Ceratodon purpureus]
MCRRMLLFAYSSCFCLSCFQYGGNNVSVNRLNDFGRHWRLRSSLNSPGSSWSSE